MAFNLKFITTPFKAVGQTIEAAGTIGSSLVVLGEGAAAKAHRFNARIEAEDKLSDLRAAAVREQEHKRLLLESLAESKLEFNRAREAAATANVDEAVTSRFIAKASALTPEQLDKLASANINTADTKAVRKYLMNPQESTSAITEEASSTGQLSTEDDPYQQLING